MANRSVSRSQDQPQGALAGELEDIAHTIEAAAHGIALEMQALEQNERGPDNRDRYRIAIFSERVEQEAERLRGLARSCAAGQRAGQQQEPA